MGNAELVAQLRAGDRPAFAALYDDYADRIHGLCASILRDPDEAADATHDVFVVALQRISQLRDPDRLRPWLFAIARHLCFRRLKQRARTSPLPPDEIVLADLVDDAHRADIGPDEAADLVWTAAGGLDHRDRALLSLHLNEGLDGADLVSALGVEHANPHSLLHRARARLDQAVSVVLIARLGQRDCEQLGGLLVRWDGELTPTLRKRLARHVDGCAICQATGARGRKLAALSSVALVPPGRAGALGADELAAIAARRPVAAERWQPDGFPPGLERAGRRRRLALLAAVLGGLFVVVLGVGIATGDDEGRAGRVPEPTPGTRPSRIVVAPATAAASSSPTSVAAGRSPTGSVVAAPGPMVTTAGGAPPPAGPENIVVAPPATAPRPSPSPAPPPTGPVTATTKAPSAPTTKPGTTTTTTTTLPDT